MFASRVTTLTQQFKLWIEHIVAGDQGRVFELFLVAATFTSITFSLTSPALYERYINVFSTIVLMIILTAHVSRRVNRNALMVSAFCIIIFEMGGSVYFHGGVWSINALWFLTMPLPVLMVMGLRAALLSIYSIMALVFTLYVAEIWGYLPPPIETSEHLMWWWICVALLSFNIWFLPIIAHVTQSRILDSLRKHNQELEQTQQVLDLETKQQDLFVASVSHELRTPMNAIMGFMQTLERRPIMHDTNAKMFAAMNHSARHLLTVINDLLDFSQIQSNSLRVASRPMPLIELLELFKPMFEQQLHERGIRYEVEIDRNIPAWAIGDPDRLTQIIINLLGNAVKFTRQGTVKLAATLTAQECLRIEVTDTGCGIAPDQIGQVFERFSSLTNRTQKAYGGTGLGLSISSNLIERMGGTIGVNSALNEGSQFWFEIPVIRCEAPQDATEHVSPPTTLSPESDLPKGLQSALIVDDSFVNRLVAKQMLLSAFPSLQITEAENGKAAIESLHQQPVDMVLMDVIMPEMDGIEATRAIRDTIFPTPPVIGLTADVTEDVETRCKQAGMLSVLTKPYDFQVLMHHVRRAILVSPSQK